MSWRLLLEGAGLLKLKPASKKEAMDIETKIILFTGFLWNYVSRFTYENTFELISSLRKLDGNTFIWEDGRTSLVGPVADSDKAGCWHYDALANRLRLWTPTANGEDLLSHRMPWMSGTFEQNGSTVDFSDVLTGLTYMAPAGKKPSIMVIRALLTQKLGIYVGGTATFRIFCRSDLINEKVFNSDLDEENDIENWNSSWD
jgi:hypothetical protein